MAATSLAALVADALGIDPGQVSDSSGMNRTDGWDSLKNFLIMTEVEQAFGVRFTMDQMERGLSVGEIRGILAEKGVAATR